MRRKNRSLSCGCSSGTRGHLSGIGLLAAVLLSGCVSQQPSEQMPEWVLQPPPDTEDTVYFNGSATVSDGGIPEATQRATEAIIDDIVRYLGVRIESTTTAEARATLDTYEAQITHQITERSEARVTGMRIVDRHVQERESELSVYLLVAYERSALEAEKQRIRSLFQERVAEVEEPAAQAAELAAQGRTFEAVQRYLDAATAAASADIDNAAVKLREMLRAATQLVSQMEIVPRSGPEQLQLNEPVSQPFRATVVRSGGSTGGAGISGEASTGSGGGGTTGSASSAGGSGSSLEAPTSGGDGPTSGAALAGRAAGGAPVPNAVLEVSYRIMRSNGRVGVETRTVRSNGEGAVEFELPRPQMIGAQTLTMALDLSAALEPLSGLDGVPGEQLDALQRAVAQTRARFQYEVVSRAREIPTAVVVLERDAAGNPLGTSRTSGGIVSALSSAGFRVRTASADPAVFEQYDPLPAIRTGLDGSVERVIYGTVGIDSFNEEDGIVVRVTGSVRAVSLESGAVVFSAEGLQYSRAANAQSALNSAFRSIGEQLGSKLVNGLP